MHMWSVFKSPLIAGNGATRPGRRYGSCWCNLTREQARKEHKEEEKEYEVEEEVQEEEEGGGEEEFQVTLPDVTMWRYRIWTLTFNVRVKTPNFANN